MSNEGPNRGIKFTGDDPRTPAYHTYAEEGEFRFPVPPGQRVIGFKFRRLPGGEPAIVEALYASEKGDWQMDGKNEVETQPLQGPPSPMRPKGLAVGRIVHYASRAGRHFAAIVADVEHRDAGVVTLAVFDHHSDGVNFHEQVPFDPSGERVGSWHYPEYAE